MRKIITVLGLVMLCGCMSDDRCREIATGIARREILGDKQKNGNTREPTLHILVEPLGKPKTEAVKFESHSTLEYEIPTVDIYDCPVHGRIAQVVEIRKKPYCEHCLWEKVVDDLH